MHRILYHTYDFFAGDECPIKGGPYQNRSYGDTSLNRPGLN